MPIDGAFLYVLKSELVDMVDCHIDKVHQPTPGEFVLLLRGRGFTGRLLISLNSESPRIHFTSATFENPDHPPMFCMLLRKYLSGARITEITQPGLERILIISLLATNELGDRVTLRLVVELTGQKTNLILIGADGRIIDAARRSDIESGARLVQPGASYTPPEGFGKLSVLESSIDEICNRIFGEPDGLLSKRIQNSVDGLSPLICRELSKKAAGDIDAPCIDIYRDAIKNELLILKNALLTGGTPTILYDSNKNEKDFSFMEITQYHGLYTCESKMSYSKILDEFYSERQRKSRLSHDSHDLRKMIHTLIQRTSRKLELRKSDLKKTKDKEKLRIYGELIKANIYMIEKGAAVAEVPNYYDTDGGVVRIPLNPALSPALNAAKYFKDYKKLCTAEQALGQLIDECTLELAYLESVSDALNRAESSADLAAIKQELRSTGYLKGQPNLRKKPATLPPHSYSFDGYTILVGKNNLQNDELTLRTASKNDLWFHTKNIPGSHVIILTEDREPEEDVIAFAANLAAYHSKASNSSQVPVDYTEIKNIKKPVGAKPGMVIYKTNKTVFVTPHKPE